MTLGIPCSVPKHIFMTPDGGNRYVFLDENVCSPIIHCNA